jgi:hypothetical protein
MVKSWSSIRDACAARTSLAESRKLKQWRADQVSATHAQLYVVHLSQSSESLKQWTADQVSATHAQLYVVHLSQSSESLKQWTADQVSATHAQLKYISRRVQKAENNEQLIKYLRRMRNYSTVHLSQSSESLKQWTADQVSATHAQLKNCTVQLLQRPETKIITQSNETRGKYLKKNSMRTAK